MSRTARSSGIVVLIGLAVAAGCLQEAPRGNPLDPESDNYRDVGSVAGQVVRFYPPHAPIEGVDVRLTQNGGAALLARTGADGRFRFDDVPAGRYAVAAEKDGYAAGRDSVTVAAGDAADGGALRLDGLPVARSVVLRTLYVGRWWPEAEPDVYLLDVTADVEDPDGLSDVASVTLHGPTPGRALTLQPTSEAGRFGRTVPADSLGAATLHALMGQPFVVEVRDHAGHATTSPPQTPARIIEETPVPVSPQGLESVADPRPVLTWQPAALRFPFTYRLDVVRVVEANLHTVLQTVERIAPETTTLRVPAALAAGTYYWTLSVVDAFGNRSRSKEAGFQVE